MTVGPVNNKNQVECVKSLIEDARSKGAEVIKLGTITNPELMDNGYFLQNTLVLGADPHDPIVVEEQFGPTIPILPFDDEEQVIQLHNESIYGLTSSIWGEEVHAIKVAVIEAGTTMNNTPAIQGLISVFHLEE